MGVLRTSTVLVLGVIWVVACSSSKKHSEVRAVVAPHFSHEDLDPGDPVAGGVRRLFDGDAVVVEAVLDEEGPATVTPTPGSYDVQVSRDSIDPGCFWGATEFAVSFPTSPISLEVSDICSGQ